MVRRFPHRPSPAMVVALLALFVALGGSSYAALRLPKNSVTTREVRDRSLLGRDFKRGQLPRGARGAQGPAGPQGSQGPQGAQGPPGPFPAILGSGQTIRGNFAAANQKDATSGDRALSAISFGYQLSSAPAPHYVPEGATPPPECPGTVANPQAQPGHLCLYEGIGSFNVLAASICDPDRNLCPATNKFGAYLEIRGSSNSTFYAIGTWAVTAP